MDDDYLPVYGEAVDEDSLAFLSSHLAKTLQQDENTRRLLVVESRIVAHHDVVEQDIDVRNLVRVKWRDVRIRVGQHVTLLYDQLQDEANLEDHGFIEVKACRW